MHFVFLLFDVVFNSNIEPKRIRYEVWGMYVCPFFWSNIRYFFSFILFFFHSTGTLGYILFFLSSVCFSFFLRFRNWIFFLFFHLVDIYSFTSLQWFRWLNFSFWILRFQNKEETTTKQQNTQKEKFVWMSFSFFASFVCTRHSWRNDSVFDKFL